MFTTRVLEEGEICLEEWNKLFAYSRDVIYHFGCLFMPEWILGLMPSPRPYAYETDTTWKKLAKHSFENYDVHIWPPLSDGLINEKTAWVEFIWYKKFDKQKQIKK